ncbi:transketolase family protein [Methanoplanus limicola]|uniref:Transketolase central region n=1 Tax=Methanoplanus limicola DSM 2279 TaxID=937775 RepID=H1YXC0_9EURY|nr:transketolase family protein [Methanoplanus limicola]EHQ36857.1 Transketolase central region [Methanoplanus limicola DSM 2279]
MYDLNNCNNNRDAFGNKLCELGKLNEEIVVLDADLCSSTKTDIFRDKFPDRFINVGIAEQNMLDIAAGMSLCGKIPFVTTFSIFGCGRGWEQIRNTIALDKLNVKMVMTHSGLSLGGDGVTHQSLEDIAIMRAIPNMHVIIPADPAETRSVIEFAVDYNGPVYVRLSRRKSPKIFDDDYKYNPKEYPILKDGTDISIFTTGNMIRKALIAAKKLENEGISAKVINVHTIKPLNKEQIIDIAKETGHVISLEEHNVIGGLGSAIAEVLIQNYPVPMKILGVNDMYGTSGKVDELFVHFNLTSETVIESANELLKFR